MLSIDVFRISTRSFKNNRLRTLLTVLGISIGIGTIFFLVSLGYGLQTLILENIATQDSLLALDVTQNSEAIDLNQESIVSIKEIPEITDIFPLISQDAQVSGNGLTSAAKINIVNPRFLSLEGIAVDKGKIFKDGENDKMIISLAALQLLDISKDDFANNEITIRLAKNPPKQNNQTVSTEETPAGENVVVETTPTEYVNKTYKISGVVADISNAYIYIPDSSVSEITFATYDKLKVRVNSTFNLEPTRARIIEKGFFVSSVSETVDQAKQIFSIAQIVLALFGVVALVVSAIGMFNTMTIALLERTQEIGIMKTIGASSYDIWRMFLTESMIIGFFGGFFGVVMGFLLSSLVNYGMNFLAGMFGGVQANLFARPIWFIAFIMVFSTVVGVITGIYPARRAAKLNALEALRYK
ncbi:MAG: ABC transporter permease [bacterium]|nr:ABC transporter permease [bacterium]